MHLQQTTHGHDLRVRVTPGQVEGITDKVVLHFGDLGEVYLSLTRAEAVLVRDGITAVLDADQAVTS